MPNRSNTNWVNRARERGIISEGPGLSHSTEAPSLVMFFKSGERPDAQALAKAVGSIDGTSLVHAPADIENAVRLEVVVNGLTFDITGVRSAEGELAADSLPDALSLSAERQGLEPVLIAPGPHLVGGGYVLPVVRGLLSLGARLGEAMGGFVAYGWPPNSRMINGKAFWSNVDSWDAGGAFPAAILVHFIEMEHGGLKSVGLSVFTGQEIRLEPDIADNPDQRMRLGYRVIAQLVLSGRVAAVEQVTGTDGAPLHLTPREDGRLVVVSRG